MEVDNLLTELEALATKLEVQVVYDHLTGEGMGPGGLCKLKGKWRIIVERRSSVRERMALLVQALSRFNLENHFLSPALREYVDRIVPPRAEG